MTDAAKWIRHPLDGDENRLVPVFRRCFAVKPGLAEATLRITAHGVYEAELNGKPVRRHHCEQLLPRMELWPGLLFTPIFSRALK